MPENGEFSETAVATKPGGSTVSLSPCEFQIRSLRGRPAKSLPGFLIVKCPWPYSRSLLRGHLATQKISHELNPVADSEHWHAQLENLRIRMRRRFCIHALRTPGQNDANHAFLAQLRCRRREVINLRVNLALANTTRDDLGELGTEIENGDDLCHAKLWVKRRPRINPNPAGLNPDLRLILNSVAP